MGWKDEEPKFTRLTLEQNDKKIVWEVPFDDVSGEDMMDAIKTIMIGMTFHPDTIINSMASYVNEWGRNLYDVVEKENPDEE